ncbi:MAG: hypothetical protein ACRDH9_00230 [Actinomycetota bacterium]
MGRISATLVVIVLSLAACGGDSGSGDGGTAQGGGSVGPVDAVRCAEVAAALASATVGATQALAGAAGGEFAGSIETLDQFAGEAPDEIAADMQVLAEGYAAVAAALEGADFDPASGQPPPPEVIAQLQAAGEALNTTEFQEANARVNDWFATECGAPAP